MLQVENSNCLRALSRGRSEWAVGWAGARPEQEGTVPNSIQMAHFPPGQR